MKVFVGFNMDATGDSSGNAGIWKGCSRLAGEFTLEEATALLGRKLQDFEQEGAQSKGDYTISEVRENIDRTFACSPVIAKR